MSHSLNSRIRASAIEQYKTTLATHDKEMEDDGVPLSRYLFNVKYVIHDTPGIYLGNPADNATLGNGASYFVQMVPKGSMPFVSEYRPPNNQDIEFLPAVPVCCPAPNLMAMAPPQMVVGCSNHCKIIVWWPGYTNELHVEIPLRANGAPVTNEYLWYHLRRVIALCWKDIKDTQLCQDAKFKLEDRPPTETIAVSKLEHLSGCYYQIRWWTSEFLPQDFLPPYFANNHNN